MGLNNNKGQTYPLWGAIIGMFIGGVIVMMSLDYAIESDREETKHQIEKISERVEEQNEEILVLQGWVVDLSYDLLDALEEYDMYFEDYGANNRMDELMYLKSLAEEQDKY